MTDVTVIGLGAMGSALAGALLKAGQKVTVWNRTAERAVPLVQHGATAAKDVRQAVAASPVIMVCVYDYAASRAVLDEAGDALAGKVLIEFSTGSPLDAREADRWARDHGADYLDGALLATPSQIGRPNTPVFLSGSETAYRRAEAVLKAVGGGLMYRGSEPGAAAAWDIAALSAMFGMMFGFFHGVRVCEAEGLSVGAFGDMMGQIAPVIGEMVRQQGRSIAVNDFANPESSMAICAGSGTLFLRQAREAGISAEFPTFADSLFRRAMTAGLGEETLSSMVKVLRG